VYAVLALSLSSTICDILWVSGIAGSGLGFVNILIIDQILQLFIVSIMSFLFIRPLLLLASGTTSSDSNVNVRSVVSRTLIGALVHIIFALVFVVLLITENSTIGAIGYVEWYLFLNLTTALPRIIHISVSHRDEKPIFHALQVFFGARSHDVAASRSSLHSYRSKIIETFEGECFEVRDSQNIDRFDEIEMGSSTRKIQSTLVS
jgi:hypothetical protein